jgi:hypothetical protein
MHSEGMTVARSPDRPARIGVAVNASGSQHSMEREESRPPDPQLEQVTASLKASLDEACSADVQRLDTDESIRIEQVLSIASKAAKEVVSLRREQRRGQPPRTGGEATATTAGAHRQFIDEGGVPWDTFAVLPTTDAPSLARLPEQFQHGWLCFESATEKRRLGPIPTQWNSASDDELRRLRDAAQPVPQRAPPPEQRNRS